VFKELGQPVKHIKCFEKRVSGVTLVKQVIVQHFELVRILQSENVPDGFRLENLKCFNNE
jgi:hypothetical protein